MRLTTCQRCGKPRQMGVACGCKPASQPQRTLTTTERGYGGYWKDYSVWYRGRHPYCVACEAAGFTTPACVVDHIVPFHSPDGGINERLRCDPANHQPLCDHRYRDCHNKLKKPLEAKYGHDVELLKIKWYGLLDELRRTTRSVNDGQGETETAGQGASTAGYVPNGPARRPGNQG